MIKVLLMGLFVLYTTHTCSAQIQCNSLNVVIVIDGEIPTTGINKILFTSNGLDTVQCKYVVGEISFDKDDFNSLVEMNNQQKITFAFQFSSSKSKHELRNYTVDVPVQWLTHKYLLVKVVNVKKERSKKRYFIDLIVPGMMLFEG